MRTEGSELMRPIANELRPIANELMRTNLNELSQLTKNGLRKRIAFQLMQSFIVRLVIVRSKKYV
jgi:hypothetical protein